MILGRVALELVGQVSRLLFLSCLLNLFSLYQFLLVDIPVMSDSLDMG